MRELKFRAWVKAGKRMLPVGEIDFDYEFAFLDEENGHRCERDFDEIELMQSTGLFDKNGIEIFENDIIKFEDYDGWEWTVNVVWCPELAYFGISFGGGYPLTFEDMKEFYTELKDIEVIGNIYETKIW